LAKKKNKKVKENTEQKQDPVALETEKDIDISASDLTTFINEIHAFSEDDINSTSTHQQSLRHWYSRRYGILDKDPQFPWPGSSNIVMPLLDMEVTKAKAPLMRMFEIDPIVSFRSAMITPLDRSDAAERTMQWLLTTRMRKFKKNMEINVDRMEMYGYGIAKVVYEYQTEVITETIRKEEIPQEDLEQIAIQLAAVQNGTPIGQDENKQPIVPTQEDFDIALTELVSQRFGFNTDDEVDQKAIEDVMNFILDVKDSVSIKRTSIVRDAPYVSPVDPSKFFIEQGVGDIQDSERTTEIFFDTENEMKKKAATGWYDAKAVKDIIDKLQQKEGDLVKSNAKSGETNNVSNQLDNVMRQREGITAVTRKGVIEMREVYCLYDIDGDGVKERCLLIYNPDTQIKVRFMEFPYEHGMWPYVQLRNEETDGRYLSSRGIPEILDDIDDVITQNHRNKLNAQAIGNSPTFKYRMGSNINPSNMQWIPGQFYPVMNMSDFEQVQVTVKDSSFDNEENNLRFWSEGLLGSFDTAFREQKSEARTATETSAIVGVQQSAQSLKISRFQRDMKKVYEMSWSLWMQYGPQDFTISTVDNQMERMNKNQMQGKFDITPVGTIGNVSPDQEFAKAQNRFLTIFQAVQQGLVPLINAQYEVDLGAAFKDMLDKDDYVASQRVLRRRSPEETQQIQQQQQQAQQQADAQAQNQAAVENNEELPLSQLQESLSLMSKQAPAGDAQRVG